jgi:hypothetical protein
LLLLWGIYFHAGFASLAQQLLSKASCACKAQTAQVAGEDVMVSLHTRTVRVILSSVSGALQMAPMAKAAKPPSVHGAETLLRGV